MGAFCDWLRGCAGAAPGSHHWEKWEDVGEVKRWERDPLHEAPDVKREVGRQVVQIRVCLLCGMKQARRYQL